LNAVLRFLTIAVSVAVGILDHRPRPGLDLITGRILQLSLRPGPGLDLIAGRLMYLSPGPGLFHGLIAGPVLQLRTDLALQLGLFALVGHFGVFAKLDLFSRAVSGTVCFRSGALPAAGGHRHRRRSDHQHRSQTNHCQSLLHCCYLLWFAPTASVAKVKE
jgi:hypothetical protein